MKMWAGTSALLENIVSEVDVSIDTEFTGHFLGISGAEFIYQPPSNIRKANFFNFTIRLFDGNQQPIAIESSRFISFCDEDVAKNGVQYSVNLLLFDGRRVQQRLFVRLVDSSTKELVKYDTPSKNAQSQSNEMQRVLVTHTAACSRCAEDKICGHMNEIPTNPVVYDSFDLRFFLKCNQNCVKGPGNPRNSRRFQLIISTTEEMDVLCISNEIFVHNNSKHERAKSFVQSNLSLVRGSKSSNPRITAISPSEGWTMGGQTIVIIGDNFCNGLQVIFDTIPVFSQFISSHAVRVQSPPRPVPGMVEVTLALDCQQYDLAMPGMFNYISPAKQCLDYGFSRLAKLVPRLHGDQGRLSKEEILKRAGDVIETFYSTQVPEVVLKQESKTAEKQQETLDENLLVPWEEEWGKKTI